MPVTRSSLSYGSRRLSNPYKRDTRKLARKATNSDLTRTFHVRLNGRDVTLRPTVVFDAFWKYSAERLAIDQRRREGLPPPWTDDRVLRQYPFANTFRVLDRSSQFIIREVIEKGSQKPIDVVFRVVLFNLFTKIETYQLLEDTLSPLAWERYNRAAYEEVLSDAKNRGVTLYTGSFQKVPAKMDDCKESFQHHLRFLEAIMNADLTGQLLSAKYMADVYAFLVSFPGFAEFNSYQLLLNLSYSHLLNFSGMDFVVGGPGSRSGLTKCFGNSIELPSMEADVIRWMAETQDEHFAHLGLKFDGLGPQGLRMGLADIEHTLCEVDKYSRIVYPQVKSRWGPMQKRGHGSIPIRGKFHPSTEPYPELCIPRAWAHPDRQIVRIKPGSIPKIPKRYVVERIIQKRMVDGEEEYLIDWWGYSRADATWEPAKNVLADAPDVVRQFIKKEGTNH